MVSKRRFRERFSTHISREPWIVFAAAFNAVALASAREQANGVEVMNFEGIC